MTSANKFGLGKGFGGGHNEVTIVASNINEDVVDKEGEDKQPDGANAIRKNDLDDGGDIKQGGDSHTSSFVVIVEDDMMSASVVGDREASAPDVQQMPVLP